MFLGQVRCLSISSSCVAEIWEERISRASTTKLCEMYKDWLQKLLCFMLLGSFISASPWSRHLPLSQDLASAWANVFTLSESNDDMADWNT